MNILDEMLQMARSAMEKAYVPYSEFAVGAVIKAQSGRLYAGCNVENAAYPAGSCAEQGAISAMILGGDTKFRKWSLWETANIWYRRAVRAVSGYANSPPPTPLSIFATETAFANQ